MDAEEERKLVNEIISNRRLPYSVEILDVSGDKYTVRNNFGSTTVYVKKDENYYLESEL